MLKLETSNRKLFDEKAPKSLDSNISQYRQLKNWSGILFMGSTQ